MCDDFVVVEVFDAFAGVADVVCFLLLMCLMRLVLLFVFCV